MLFQRNFPQFDGTLQAWQASSEGGKGRWKTLGKDFSNVSYRPAPQKTASMYIKYYEAFNSRESALQDVMEALKGANLNMIGMYEMGGVGG